ncbi:MAG: class I SAM-dependent methyltransferase [Acidobacteria bacterium]|nr:class I SAM-dependent methyltransferase [Acidobacteriota bacterium]
MNTINDTAAEMKRDWNERAERNAKWYINTYKLEQTDEEFDESAREDLRANFFAVLPALTWRRNPKQLRLLEIGCGVGRMSRHFANVYGEVHGVDVSGEMIRQARERLKDLPNAHFHETSGVDFQAFPDDHFDTIYSAYVFQHVPARDAIVSNIRDAYRTLARGGVFMYGASAIHNAEFEAIPKNTWTGASFGEADSRALARELGAQVIRVIGDGTQYCWTTLRKPDAEAKSEPLIVAFGRADDLTVLEIPARGPQACLALHVTGLAASALDCNQLALAWANVRNQPFYAGPQDVSLDDALAGNYANGEPFIIKANVPNHVPLGAIAVSLHLPDRRQTEAVTIEILPADVPPPVITQLGNEHDGGVDIHASGPKSVLRVFAAGLDEQADTTNTRLHVGETTLPPRSVAFLAMNAVWEIIAPLPADTAAQSTELSVSYQGRRSTFVSLTIKE